MTDARAANKTPEPGTAASRDVAADANLPAWYGRLNGLREEVHVVLADEFRIVAGDLEQLRGLLGDAAGNLSQAFRDVVHASEQIRQAATTLSGSACAANVEPMAEHAQRIVDTSSVTVQSLQFEDMASQLLAHVSRRLDILEAFSKDMTILVPSPTGRPLPASDEALDQLAARIGDYRAELAAAKRKSVHQQSLEAGGIELF